MRKKDTKGMGHNNPPKELADLINDQGRVKINKEAMALYRSGSGQTTSRRQR